MNESIKTHRKRLKKMCDDYTCDYARMVLMVDTLTRDRDEIEAYGVMIDTVEKLGRRGFNRNNPFKVGK